VLDSSFIDGIERIWWDDRAALYIVFMLIAIQLIILWWARRRTGAQLRRSGKQLRELSRAVTTDASLRPEDIQRLEPALRTAWGAVLTFGNDQWSAKPAADVATAFASQHLLPVAYNSRLDSAAPGLFTALGIFGTFLGLILAFLRVDPANALAGVTPLIGGMVVAFVNSLLGVALSIWWSVRSRLARHDFDRSAGELARTIRYRYDVPSVDRQTASQLDHIALQLGRLSGSFDAGFARMQATSLDASQRLLDNLAPRLEESFGRIVSMPFDRLGDSIDNFERIVVATAARHEAIIQALHDSSDRLSTVRSLIDESMVALTSSVQSFGAATDSFERNASASSELVDRTRHAASSLQSVTDELKVSSEQYHGLIKALNLSNEAVAGAGASMRESSSLLRDSAAHLSASTDEMKSVLVNSIAESSRGISEGLVTAVQGFTSGLEEIGTKTVAAYEQSSGRVIEAVDESMTDLTDRLSAELNTLAARLPAEVEQLNAAMGATRREIQAAIRSLEVSVKALANESPEILNKHLDVYDGALAKATDHFGGTLKNWDDKLSAIGDLAVGMSQLAALAERRLAMLERPPEGSEAAA
jgi:ABC-type transporter Mla subunit MlaD